VFTPSPDQPGPDHLGEIPTLSESVAHHPRRPLATIGLSSLAATLTSLPASVANKRLTARLKPFRCNTYKKPGVGIPLLAFPDVRPLDVWTFRRFPIPLSPYPSSFCRPHPTKPIRYNPYKKQWGVGPPVGMWGYSSHFGLARATPKGFTRATCAKGTIYRAVTLHGSRVTDTVQFRLLVGCRLSLPGVQQWLEMVCSHRGAPLIACVISLAAVGKSPLFDEIRASRQWLAHGSHLFVTRGNTQTPLGISLALEPRA